MVLSETVVSALLEASITGAGLVLAAYALLTPIYKKIFTDKAKKLKGLLKEFEEEKKKIAGDAPDKDFRRFNQLRKEIKKVGIFPWYLSIGIISTFTFFMLSVFFTSLWLMNETERTMPNEIIMGSVFLLAVVSFLFVGISTIFEIINMMWKEFEDIKKKQKEAKEYKTSS